MSASVVQPFTMSAVATAPSPATSGTSLVVTSGMGSSFPAAPFNAIVVAVGEPPSPANAEIIRVTAKSTDTLTIARAQKDSTARSIQVGDQVFAGAMGSTISALGLTLQSIEDRAGTTDAVTIPAISAGRYVAAGIGYNNGTQSFSANRIYFSPLLWINRSRSFDRIGINVTAGGSAGSVYRFGIYNDDGSYRPGTLVADYGTVATTGVAFQEITISQTLAAGTYWVAAVPQVAVPTVTRIGTISLGIASSLNTDLWGLPYQDGVTGALPSPATVTFSGSANTPAVALRTA